MTRQKLNSIVMPFNYNYWNLSDVILGTLDLQNATLLKSFTHATQLSLKSKYKTHSFRCAIIFPWSLSTGCLLLGICLLLEIIVLIAREQQKCSVIETHWMVYIALSSCTRGQYLKFAFSVDTTHTRWVCGKSYVSRPL